MTVQSIDASEVFRVGDVLSRAWRIFIGNILFFLLVPFVIQLITIFAVSLSALMLIFAGWATGSVVLMGLGIFLAAIVALGLYMVGQAIVLLGAFQRLRGQPLQVGEAVQRALGRFWPLVGLGLLWGLVIGGISSIYVAIAFGLWDALSVWVFALAPIFVIPLTILFLMWTVAVPACVVEGSGPTDSMGRSAVLTKGYRWKILGMNLLLVLLAVACTMVQGMLTMASQALGAVFNFLWPVAWAGYWNCAIIMTYHDLRVAKEGVDTEQIAAIFD
jgi:hypothetical protein